MPRLNPKGKAPNLREWVTVNTGPFSFARPAAAGGVRAVLTHTLSTFAEWLEQERPEFTWSSPHFQYMHAGLQRITDGTSKRLVLSVAVRHGKTESITSYAAYRITLDPALQVLVGSYNHDQASKISRDIRRLCKQAGVVMSDIRDAAREWETSAGGGVRAVGAGAGVASVNAGLILIDDPVGSRDEAESALRRERVWEWFTNDILARTVPDTAVVVSHPRWHPDDVIGRLKDRQRDRWEFIELAGRAEADDVLGRAVGDPLWPAMRDTAWLDEKRVELGDYGFASLVQGRPRPREGGMFKWEWWKLIDAVPEHGPMVRYWDLAGTEQRSASHDPDWSAGVLACRMPDMRTAIVDVARVRQGVAARDAYLEKVCMDDIYRYRGRVRWWIETEAGIQGTERTAHLVRRLQALGMVVNTEHPTGNKVHRAEPLASKAEAGNVVLCTGAWRDAFRLEAADFPNGAHDDQMDAAAGADAKLTAQHMTVTRTLII